MSNITRLLEGKLSRDLQHDINSNSTSSQTVEELLEMLSSSNTTKKPPPPIPPKPKNCLDRINFDNNGRKAIGTGTSMNSNTVTLNEHHQPPRTSTPSYSLSLLDNTSSSGASTATNNNKSSQNAYSTHDNRESTSDHSEGDTLNISRDTDELTNTSAHNQSGCELIGVNDNSDQSPKKNNLPDNQTPFIVQVFDETMSPTLPDHEHIVQHPNDTTMNDTARTSIIHERDSNSLRRLVNSLQNEIENLNNKVTSLTVKVEDLELQLEDYKKDTNFNRSSSSFSNTRLESCSPSGAMNKFSRSTSTINKLTPMKSRHNGSHGTTSTYLRNNAVTTNSHSVNTPTPCLSNSSLGNKYSTGIKHMPPSSAKSISTSATTANSSISRPLRKSCAYTSTNSLYADSLKSGGCGSTSISPTPTGSYSHKQTASPTSLLNLSSIRRDPLSYTSMLSLTSIGNSTLKKGCVTGSVSNLSHVTCSQLSQWPSISNFLPSKNQAKDVLYDEDERVIRMVLYNTLITMRLPSWIENNYNLDRIVERPNVRLKLDWVHGYRGRDCRSNIFYLPTGECVYFVASIVVLYNPDEMTQRHYLGHTDSVKCLAVHPNKLIVATGQSAVANRRDKRPIVRVWNTVSLATLRVIGFNEDFDRSICCLAFSKHDQGATLAVVDESSEHTITLLDWQREKNWRVAEVNSGHEPVLVIDFHPIDKYSLVAVGKSMVNFWDIRGMTLAKKAGLFDKYDRPKYVLCLTFNDLGETITGDSNGNIIIWPRGSNKPRRIIRDAHPGGVFSILAMKDGSYLTGGRDGRVIEWDEELILTGRQTMLPEQCGGVRFITYARGSQVLIGTLRNSILIGSIENNFTVIMQGHTEATTALAIHPNQPKYLTGGFDDQIFFIDTTTHCVESIKCLAIPATSVCYSPNGQLLIIGSTSGCWLAFDARTQEILFTAYDGSGTINCVKFSSTGRNFCLGSSDCHAYLYETTETGNVFRRIGTCVGHSAPIEEIDWSHDNCYVKTQSMNFELLYWHSQSCRPVDDDSLIADLKWNTYNCTLGFDVIGIWSDSIDSALINYCDRSNNGDYIVSTTDTGYINIFKWPTHYNQCLSQKYYGNVEKFNFIRFSHDDTRLIAVGAKSCVTTEWTLERTD